MRYRIVFAIILTFLTASIVIYIFWIPYRPFKLYRAIPANAILVSSHQNLAGRWLSLSTNVMIKSLFSTMASEPDSPRVPVGYFPVCPWISRLACRETIIAYVPSLGPAGEPAWIISCWIGRYSQYLRWSLCFQRVPGVRRLANYCNSRPVWRFRQPLTQSGLQMSLAFGEGVLLGCLSRNPDGIRHVLMAYDGLVPSMASSSQFRPPLPQRHRSMDLGSRESRNGIMRDPSALDQGWFRYLQPGKKLNETLMFSYTIRRLNSDKLSADIRVQPELSARTALSETIDIPAFGQLLGDLPALMMMLPLDMANDLLTQPSAPAWARLISRELKANVFSPDTKGIVVTLLTGDYSGGFGKAPLRIKIPTLMAFVKVRQPDEVKSLINEILDVLNARYRLGLIVDPGALPARKQTVFTIEATMNNILSTLAVEDRPAYAVVGQWLIFSSNAQSLVKLLERYQAGDLPSITQKGRWQKKLEESKASAFIWMDLKSGGKASQLALTAYAVSLRNNPATSSSPSLNVIKMAKAWLEDVRPWKTCSLWMESATPSPVIHLDIGGNTNDTYLIQTH